MTQVSVRVFVRFVRFSCVRFLTYFPAWKGEGAEGKEEEREGWKGEG